MVSCASCGYPLAAKVGEQISCPYCQSPNLIQQGVTIPSGLFWGVTGFVIGLVFGKAIVKTGKAGIEWAEKKVVERAGR